MSKRKIHQAFYNKWEKEMQPACGTPITKNTLSTLNMHVTCKRCLARRKK